MHPERYLGGTQNKDGDDNKAATTTPATPRKKKRSGPDQARHAHADTSARSEPEAIIPDTCVAFQRYLESGRVVNVYDWFAAFSGTLKGLETKSKKKGRALIQAHEKGSTGPDVGPKAKSGRGRERGRGRGRVRNGAHVPPSSSSSRSPSPPPSPTKSRGRGRGRARGRPRGRPNGVGQRGRGAETQNAADDQGDPDTSESSSDDDDDESDDARSKREAQVQARFLRAVQELDFLGFVKHTGRRAEHVQKTVFDPPEF